MPGRNAKGLQVARYAALAACTFIALSCGTNYVYSAYAPQLASKLHLSTTESNIIGISGNLGMYLTGIPAGILVDSKGPRLAIMIGAVSLFVGYYPIYRVYDAGDNIGVPWLALFSIFTGVGSCFAFIASIKVAAMNFPKHRGTATALPLAAFGLSAFFFSALASALFPGNTSGFLLVLSIATSSIVFIAFFFVRIVPVPGAYSILPTSDSNASRSERLHRTKSRESTGGIDEEPGMKTVATTFREVPSSDDGEGEDYSGQRAGALEGTSSSSSRVPAAPADDETTSFLSTSSDSSSYGSKDDVTRGSDAPIDDHGRTRVDENRAVQHVDIRGWALTKVPEFWRLFLILGILTGIGLMTINNIGHSVQALWYAHNPNVDPKYVERRQGIHVSILSLCSFAGRLLSGTMSDLITKKWSYSRTWMVFTASTLFLIGQIAGMSVSNPYSLWLVSSLNGFGYGLVFGVFPTIVSEAFGLHGLSQNWGTMTLAPVIFGNITNLFYGRIYDSHSRQLPSGLYECSEGIDCYRSSYILTALASICVMALSLWSIYVKRFEVVSHTGGDGGFVH